MSISVSVSVPEVDKPALVSGIVAVIVSLPITEITGTSFVPFIVIVRVVLLVAPFTSVVVVVNVS